jgi:hypothetical protein
VDPADGGGVDGGPTDGGVDPTDGGAGDGTTDPLLPDADGDRISDVNEGRGRVDTDLDGIPDSLDLDSDGDGLPDRQEAGDDSLTSPPVDTDRDLVPDYRDLDSDDDGLNDALEGGEDFDGDGLADYRDRDVDDDGIDDAIETSDDIDGDGIGNWRDLDSDGDGLSDASEGEVDPDGDGVPAFLDLDSDGDSLLDADEGDRDPDRDQLPAFLDVDSDGDGLLDRTEGGADRDGDGLPNYLDADADGDGVGDQFEGPLDFDGDGDANFLDLDSDADGLDDALEARVTGVDQPPVDSDADGQYDFVDVDADEDYLPDAVEALSDHDGDGVPGYIDLDSDADGLLDREEAGDASLSTPPLDFDGDGTPDHLDLDSDDDTIADLEEGRADSDLDGTPDRNQLDADADGISDRIEAGDADLATEPVDTDGDSIPDYRDTDSDDDGLLDIAETGCPGASNRLLIDSDADSFQDTAELAVGTDPCDPASGIDDFYFVLPATGAQDSDFLVFDDTEVDQADIGLNVDTTGSMGDEITNLRNSLSTIIVPGVQAVISSPAFAVSSFQDFPVAPFGSAVSGDLPFQLNQRVTTNVAGVQSALNQLTIRNGEDTRESGIEALFQVATGVGVQWSSGSVAAFDPALNQVAGVADGALGGVGFRDDSLPVVVHVSDAPSHLSADYGPSIAAAGAETVRRELTNRGIRVITITGEDQPRAWSESQLRDRFRDYCTGIEVPFMGEISGPQGSDVDWYRLDGVAAGATVEARVDALAIGSALDPMAGIYDAAGTQLAFDNDRSATDVDAEVTTVLSGPAPYYVAVSAFNDPDFNGSGAVTAGHYFLDVRVNGQRYGPNVVQCSGVDAGDRRTSAFGLVPMNTATLMPSLVACEDACFDQVGAEELRVPYGIARASGAQVPPCAWDLFGTGRPAGCGSNQCCTGLSGAGVSAADDGSCPLAFEVTAAGAGIDQALVAGIEALVNFSEFTITTRVRPDPAALPAVDTSCFIQRVTPQTGAAPNTCAPAPVAARSSTAAVGLDAFESVVPGSTLEFEVVASNADANGAPCAPASQNFQVFRAFIDVLADDVAQLATRDVVIVVPPGQAPGGS